MDKRITVKMNSKLKSFNKTINTGQIHMFNRMKLKKGKVKRILTKLGK